ncbi:hypothetical protein EV644_12237 [Kribbella orskensis]|uniref:MarR family transcriptional regulator n=1 Tax=Kribbella orskensis TaxID=2512216 RepID=A0ABY2BAB7_9ACTN|nr:MULTISPECIES: hypothetical protein [Kribbella]TCN33416.1 hypothetical protein EV642_12437 [Kribbella sp. VKM Ac-2500]TCO13562.1 hypothetical protein EV644_12237 [Kribbella orskensis]
MTGETAGQSPGSPIRTEATAALQQILDLFEGAQQIQQLIVARRLLGKTSAELK